MPRIQDLPGVEGPGVSKPKIKAIEVAAGEYEKMRDTRMSWTKKEVESRAKLIELMKKHELEQYDFGDHRVELIPGVDKIKVRTINGEDEGEDPGED